MLAQIVFDNSAEEVFCQVSGWNLPPIQPAGVFFGSFWNLLRLVTIVYRDSRLLLENFNKGSPRVKNIDYGLQPSMESLGC